MSKQTKTSFAAYAAWNVEIEELTLNKQSEHGWQLRKGGCYHTVYEADDTVRYIHKIDYNPDVSQASEEKERYIELFEQQGWEYVNSTFNGWHYFRKLYDETLPIGEYEIYTDSDSYSKMMKRWIRLGQMLQILQLIPAVMNVWIGITLDSGSNLFMGALLAAMIIWLQYGIHKMKEKI